MRFDTNEQMKNLSKAMSAVGRLIYFVTVKFSQIEISRAMKDSGAKAKNIRYYAGLTISHAHEWINNETKLPLEDLEFELNDEFVSSDFKLIDCNNKSSNVPQQVHMIFVPAKWKQL